MQVLVDTHALLWFLSGDSRLSGAARTAIEEPNNDVFVSVASLWEITIKVSLNRLPLHAPYTQLFPAQLEQNEIAVLGADERHFALVAELPFHHRDPFDRLIVAQALIERVPIIAVDGQFDAYGVERIW